ncbi:MAG: PrsW family intramembrane metalloprotease [Anaerolineales bacterium]|nr:PrsW family intramembrane metalloprotease [Anaerolineales bacterium]
MSVETVKEKSIKNMPGQMPLWQKRTIKVIGILMAIVGLPVGVASLCVGLLSIIDGSTGQGLAVLLFGLLAFGGGLLTAYHANASIDKRPSKPLKLPKEWVLVGAFVLLVYLGVLISPVGDDGVVFAPVLIVLALLPPTWAMAWFRRNQPDTLTARRGIVALIGGATVSVLFALLLEVLFPTIILSLVYELYGSVLVSVRTLLRELAWREIARALTSPGFIFAFVHLAIVAPLAEELAKPLVTLPVIGYLSKREAFLVGAMAGIGFAAVENVLYAGFGFSFWAGILVVRALGGAIHPLGSGLVAAGWQGVLRREKDALRKWLSYFGLAVGIHALWNGGSLLVITLAGAQFFGDLPPEIDVLGLSAGGTTLAFLIVLGLAALWLGEAIFKTEGSDSERDADVMEELFMVSDRAMAIWAFACLVAFVPAGIAGLQLILR